MKIITLWQPWATCMWLGLKEFETRHWSTDYRGELLIHSAKRQIDEDGKELVQKLHAAGHDVPTNRSEYPLGCIGAIARLSDCVSMTDGLIRAQTSLERSVGLWESGRFALKVDGVIRCEPIPWTSRQGKLLPAPDDIVEQVLQSDGRGDRILKSLDD